MIFKEMDNGLIRCEGWDDLVGDDMESGFIKKYDDGYYRFIPNDGIYMNCSDAMSIGKKLQSLNTV